MLGGESATLYDDIDDLVSLHMTESDRLTGFMQDRFGFLFRVSLSKRNSQVTWCA